MSGDNMAEFISALTNSSTGITSTAMWGEATNAVPLIVAVVIFAFGYSIIRRVTKGASKGKFRM